MCAVRFGSPRANEIRRRDLTLYGSASAGDNLRALFDKYGLDALVGIEPLRDRLIVRVSDLDDEVRALLARLDEVEKKLSVANAELEFVDGQRHKNTVG